MKKIKLIYWFWGLFGLIQILSANIYFIGYFVDDAVYIILAQAIAQASALPFDPTVASFRDALAGFPLLLAPFVKLVGPASWGLRLLPLLSVFLAGVIYIQLTKDSQKGYWGLLSLTLFSFNTMVIRFGGAILAESSYIMFGLLSSLLIIKDDFKRPWRIAILLAFTAMLRPQGIFFIGGALWGVLNSHNWRHVLKCAAWTSLFYVGAIGLQVGSSGHMVQYFDTWGQHATNNLSLASYLTNLKGFLGYLVPGTFFNLPQLQNFLVRRIVAWASIFLVAGFSIWGAAKNWNDPFTRISSYYSGLTIVLLPLWIGLNIRYALVLIPFVTYLFIQGLMAISKWHRLTRAIPAIFIILWLPWHILGNLENVRLSFHPSAPLSLPRKTLQFIVNQIDPQSRISSPLAPMIQLYTGRPCERFSLVPDEASFFRLLKNRGVTHIVMRDNIYVPYPPSSIQALRVSQNEVWARSSQFTDKIFSDPVEKTEIYQLK